ncbi:unnamed protein product, partial [Cyprideis torosa]
MQELEGFSKELLEMIKDKSCFVAGKNSSVIASLDRNHQKEDYRSKVKEIVNRGRTEVTVSSKVEMTPEAMHRSACIRLNGQDRILNFSYVAPTAACDDGEDDLSDGALSIPCLQQGDEAVIHNAHSTEGTSELYLICGRGRVEAVKDNVTPACQSPDLPGGWCYGSGGWCFWCGGWCYGSGGWCFWCGGWCFWCGGWCYGSGGWCFMFLQGDIFGGKDGGPNCPCCQNTSRQTRHTSHQTRNTSHQTTDLAAGVSGVAAGVTDLAAGVTDLAAGVSGVAAGVTVLAAGVTDLAAGVSGVATGVTDLAAGVSGVAAGVTDLAAGVTDLPAGVSGLAAGFPGLAAGFPGLAAGVTSLVAGVTSLPAGVSGLAAGVTSLVAGVTSLVAGVTGLTAGVLATWTVRSPVLSSENVALEEHLKATDTTVAMEACCHLKSGLHSLLEQMKRPISYSDIKFCWRFEVQLHQSLAISQVPQHLSADSLRALLWFAKSAGDGDASLTESPDDEFEVLDSVEASKAYNKGLIDEFISLPHHCRVTETLSREGPRFVLENWIRLSEELTAPPPPSSSTASSDSQSLDDLQTNIFPPECFTVASFSVRAANGVIYAADANGEFQCFVLNAHQYDPGEGTQKFLFKDEPWIDLRNQHLGIFLVRSPLCVSWINQSPIHGARDPGTINRVVPKAVLSFQRSRMVQIVHPAGDTVVSPFDFSDLEKIGLVRLQEITVLGKSFPLDDRYGNSCSILTVKLTRASDELEMPLPRESAVIEGMLRRDEEGPSPIIFLV